MKSYFVIAAILLLLSVSAFAETESTESSVEDAVEAQLDIVSAADAMMLDSDSVDEERWRGWGRRHRSAPRYSAPARRAPAPAPRRPSAAQVARKAAKMAKQMAAKMAKKMAKKAARKAKRAARKAALAAKKSVKKVVKKVAKKLSFRARRAFEVPKLKYHFKLSTNLIIPPAMFRRKFKSMSHMRAEARVASYKSQLKLAVKKLNKAKKEAANALKKAGYTLAQTMKNVRSCKKQCKVIKTKLAAMKKLHVKFTAGVKHQLALVQSDYNDFAVDLKEHLSRAQDELTEIVTGKKALKKSANKKRTAAKLLKAKSLIDTMRNKVAKLSHELKVAQVANAELTEKVANMKSAHLKELASIGKMHLTLDEANVIIAKLLRRVRNPPMVGEKKHKK